MVGTYNLSNVRVPDGHKPAYIKLELRLVSLGALISNGAIANVAKIRSSWVCDDMQVFKNFPATAGGQ